MNCQYNVYHKGEMNGELYETFEFNDDKIEFIEFFNSDGVLKMTLRTCRSANDMGNPELGKIFQAHASHDFLTKFTLNCKTYMQLCDMYDIPQCKYNIQLRKEPADRSVNV